LEIYFAPIYCMHRHWGGTSVCFFLKVDKEPGIVFFSSPGNQKKIRINVFLFSPKYYFLFYESIDVRGVVTRLHNGFCFPFFDRKRKMTSVAPVSVESFSKYALERGGENSLVGLHKTVGLGRHMNDQTISTYGQTLEGKFAQFADVIVGTIALADMWEIKDVAPMQVTDTKAISGKIREFRTVRAPISPELGTTRKVSHREVSWVSESFRIALAFEYSLEQTFSAEGIRTIVLQIAQVASSLGYSAAMAVHEGFIGNSCVGPTGGFQTIEQFIIYINNAFACINKSMAMFAEVIRRCVGEISNTTGSMSGYKMVVPPGTAYRLMNGDRSPVTSTLLIGDGANQKSLPVTVSRGLSYGAPKAGANNVFEIAPGVTAYETRQLYDGAQQFGLAAQLDRTNPSMLELLRIGSTGEYFHAVPRDIVKAGYNLADAHKTRDYTCRVYDFDAQSLRTISANEMFTAALGGWFDATSDTVPSKAVVTANPMINNKHVLKGTKDKGPTSNTGGKFEFHHLDHLYDETLAAYANAAINAANTAAADGKIGENVNGRAVDQLPLIDRDKGKGKWDFTLANIKVMLKHNIPLPFSVAGLRPNMTFSTSPSYLASADAGFTTIGQSNATAAVSATDKSVEAHFSAYIGMHVPDPRKVQRIEDSKINAYLFGGGLKPFANDLDNNAFRYRHMSLYKTGKSDEIPSVMYVLLGYDERLPVFFDITGKWDPTYYGASTTTFIGSSKMHYSTAAVYSAIYNIDKSYKTPGKASYLNDRESYSLNSGRSNCIVSRGMSYTYSELTKDYTTLHHGQGGLGAIMNSQIQLNLNSNWETANNLVPGVVFAQ